MSWAPCSNIVTTTFLPAPVLPAGRPRLVLTGFMGTGKSTAGKEAAALLGLPFVDLDRIIDAATRLANKTLSGRVC